MQQCRRRRNLRPWITETQWLNDFQVRSPVELDVIPLVVYHICYRLGGVVCEILIGITCNGILRALTSEAYTTGYDVTGQTICVRDGRYL